MAEFSAAKRSVIDAVLKQSAAEREVPFIVAMSGTAEGVTYSGVFGDRATGAPATMDTNFRLFSMSKPIGQFCAMMLHDRGLLDYETPVADILPDYARIQVCTGFDGNTPILRAPQTTATVRHLATHTAGQMYDSWSPEMTRWAALTGYPGVVSGKREYLFAPMFFDPGTQWGYGTNTTWLGLVVEKLAGKELGQFVQEEIFDPLGMTQSMFDPTPEAKMRMAPTLFSRAADGGFEPMAFDLPANPEFNDIGQSIQCTAADYMQFLRMLLNQGQFNGHRFMSEAAFERMYSNAIGDMTVPAFASTTPNSAAMDFFPGTKKTHSLLGVRTEEDIPGMRRAGSQYWAGFANTHFWLDPASNTAGIYVTQSLPFVEPAMMEGFAKFEQAVYA